MTRMLLPTSVIGSYALPSWLWLAREAMAAGRYGARDIAETLEDATRLAIDDQIEAGVDIISDGEMRRTNFILGFYGHLSRDGRSSEQFVGSNAEACLGTRASCPLQKRAGRPRSQERQTAYCCMCVNKLSTGI